ncbi:MAG: M15 family metallopeptidase [Spirochaetaceae bacterium]|nr:MAG: M15 family metallopeptidase [Spirochaetaceae bacterium]
MKHLSLLTAIGMLLSLSGISCEIRSNPDARSKLEVSGSLDILSAGTGSTDGQTARGRPADARPGGVEQAGEAEMKALAQAYPNRIEEIAFRNEDWALRIGDTWYFWAKGRLLPEELRLQWEEYASYRFYSYSLDLPPLPVLDEESKLRLRERLERAEDNPPRRSEAFLADLYRSATRGKTEARIGTVELVGFDVRVHEQIVEPLRKVNRALEALAEIDPGVQRFVAGLNGVAGYNWREIAGTRSRSYHSYGVAIDLTPKSFGGRHTYWRWALPHSDEWYAIPYEQRWMVPLQIVKIFEEQGFVWGGKWFYFDTMHFEYRPEILILAKASGDRR